MALKTITSANSKFTLIVPALALGPFTLQGYSADAAFTSPPVESAQTVMGVDGKMSAGFVPFITPIEVTLQPDSASLEFFRTWLGGMKAVKELAYASATIDIPAIQQSFICTKGALRMSAQIPPAAKVLQPQVFTIDWEDVQPVPLIGVV